MIAFPGIRRQECRNSVYSEPQMDLLAPSCWDAPEASAHSSYCAISWMCLQLYNTASVPGVIQSNWDTRGSVSQSDWCSLSYSLILCLVHKALHTWLWLLCLCGNCFSVFLCFLKPFQHHSVLYVTSPGVEVWSLNLSLMLCLLRQLIILERPHKPVVVLLHKNSQKNKKKIKLISNRKSQKKLISYSKCL